MPARILIIEDDPASRELARYLLDHAGYTTLTAADGAAGVELALSGHPDLVLCDLNLPMLTGYEVVQRLLDTSQNWRRVPIVALTASSMVGDREKTLQAGFDSYLSKPITPETFVQEVGAFLPPGLRADP